MPLHSIIYEFPLIDKNIEAITDDFGITLGSYWAEHGFWAGELETYPGVVMTFDKKFFSERLPHVIEGVLIHMHASSAGQLSLGEFSRYFEASLEKNNIKYNRY